MSGFWDRFKRKRDVKDAEKKKMIEAGGKTEEVAFKELAEQVGYSAQFSYDPENGPVFRTKLTNRTTDLLGEPTISISVSNEKVLKPCNREEKIGMLEEGGTEIFKFYLEPMFEQGIVKISPRFSYFDFNDKTKIRADLPKEKVRMVLPPFRKKTFQMKEIFDADWKVIVSTMEDYETETDMLKERPSAVFRVFAGALRSLGLHAFKPDVFPGVYRAVGKFWAEGKGDEKYGIHLEVVGRDEGEAGKIKSKTLIIFYATDYTKLMPFVAGVVSSLRKNCEYGRSLRHATD